MENRKRTNIVLVVMGALILMEMITSIISVIEHGIISAMSLSAIASLVFIAIYGFILYKKPHGNILKYAMLLLALAQVLNYADCLKMGYIEEYISIIGLISAGIVVYVSGRLNRIEQNKYLLMIALILELFNAIFSIVKYANFISVAFVITYLFESIAILTLMIAYFVRYKEHKEAGLTDK